MAQSAFEVTYDGPALADGRMPVRDLAPALLALGDLFAEASITVYPHREPVALNIRATQEGSFVVQLILESAWDRVLDIFNSDGANALINLKEYVLGGGFGLFWLIKHLRGRHIEKAEPTPDPGQIRLTLDDGTTIEIPAQVARLYENIEVRKRARQVVEPLTRPGVEVLTVRSDTAISVEVTSEDVPAYEPPTVADVPLDEVEIPMFVSIASVAFTEGNKWRLTDGDRTFYATIADEGFLHRVELGQESFRKGDMLRCVMRIVQTRRDDGLHTDYIVAQVLEHIPRQTQMRLDDVASRGNGA